MDIVATKPHLIFNLIAFIRTWLGVLTIDPEKA